MNSEIEKRLIIAGITPTPVRKLVAKAIIKSECPVSLIDIESILETVDRSTISRTLSIFKQRNFVHTINDGSGSAKYELCPSSTHDHSDEHVHFHCSQCGKTFCLNGVRIPKVQIPEDMIIESINYVIQGICSNCK